LTALIDGNEINWDPNSNPDQNLESDPELITDPAGSGCTILRESEVTRKNMTEQQDEEEESDMDNMQQEGDKNNMQEEEEEDEHG
jgi:hypothetical protein